MSDTFFSWTINFFEDEELPFYVRLSQLESFYPNETVWFLDYGRFKTFEEASSYIDTLPEPEEALKEENKVFENHN